MNFKEFQQTWQPFDEYVVKIKVPRIAGGIPKDPEMMETWVNATNKKKSEEERKKIVEATKEQMEAVTDEVCKKNGTGFKSEEGKGLYIEGRQLKSMLKEAANIIKDLVPSKEEGEKGIKALKSKVADRVFVVEEKVFLGKTEPDSVEDRPISVIVAQGPRTSIKRTEYVHNVELTFTVRRLHDSAVPEKTLYAILSYSQQIGLGAERSQGCGIFEIVSVTKTE